MGQVIGVTAAAVGSSRIVTVIAGPASWLTPQMSLKNACLMDLYIEKPSKT